MIRNRRTAEHYKWGNCDAWRLLDQPDLTVIQELMPPGAAEVRHFHRRARQLFFVLAGRMQIEMAEQVLTLEAGDSIEVAPQQPHCVRNASADDLSLLVVSAPSTHGDREENEPLQGERRR